VVFNVFGAARVVFFSDGKTRFPLYLFLFHEKKKKDAVAIGAKTTCVSFSERFSISSKQELNHL
jgi:hypothetical protein